MPRYRAMRKKKPTIHDLTLERDLTLVISQALSLHGFMHWHIPDRSYAGDRCEKCGHQNPPKGLGAGLPDHIAVGPRSAEQTTVVFWEDKSEGGKPTEAQVDALGLFNRAAYLDTRVVRPSDLDEALRLLTSWGRR